MSDSGVKWIGNIPNNWTVTKLKYLIDKVSSGGTPDSSNDMYYSLENGIPWVTISDMSTIREVKKTTKKISDLAIKDKKLTIYKPGVLLLAMYASVGKVARLCVPATVNQAILAIECNKEKLSLAYSEYCFNAYEPYLMSESNGTTQFNLNANTVLNLYVPYIPLPIQNKIVEVLDNKISKIDALIANENKQTERLEEYKKAVITKVVTKGLNPNDKMKDSGVKWIGKIPEGWNTIKIKFTSWLKGRIGWDGLKSSEFIDEGPFLITGTDFENGHINWNTCVHISEERFQEDELLHIKENDLLITKDGTIGKLAIVENCPEKVSLNSGVMIIRNDSNYKYVDRYMYYLLQSNQFNLWFELSQSGNSTIRHLYQGQFYDFEYTYPSLFEQQQIADYLDEKCEKINRIIEIKKSKIEKLQDYKKSLIYEYVTGKKEVC